MSVPLSNMFGQNTDLFNLIYYMKSIIKNIKKDTYNTINDLSVQELEEIILYANDQYYNNDNPVLSDAQYDILIDFLKLKNSKSLVLKTIGANVKDSQNKVVLDYHMGSMDKIKPPSPHLQNWLKQYSAPYILSDKLDGISGLLIYRPNGTINLYTRGNSTEGIDVSKIIKYLNLPSYDKPIAVRGELIMSKTNFDLLPNTKSQRNTTSGIILSKTINPELASKVSFVCYELVDPVMSIEMGLERLEEIGFEVVHYDRVSGMSYNSLSDYFKIRREESEYDIDGIIVSDTKKHKRNTTGNPKYAFAFKTDLDDQKAETEVLEVEWNKSKHGVYKPVIIIRTVLISGVEISRVTGFNAKYIVDNNIGKNTKVEIIRSGDVIPKISKIIKPSKYRLPVGSWSWNKTGVDIVADDMNASDIEIKNIHNFFVVLGTKGLGLRTIERLYEAGYNTIRKLYEISVEEIMEMDGFKRTSASNIVKTIQKSGQNIRLYELMAASNKLGLGFGVERCKKIVDVYPDILTRKIRVEDIQGIDGFDTVMAEYFMEGIEEFRRFYSDIRSYIKIKEENREIRMRVVFSGFRDRELERELGERGVEVVNTVSSKVKYLIVKDDEYEKTSKVKKAIKMGIKIITYDEINRYIR